MSTKILVIHGPNLNLLGRRQREIYGKNSLKEINRQLLKLARKEKVTLDFFQSNNEGEIVERLQEADGCYGAIVLNPAAFTHTSVAIRDAASAIEIPVIEVHISNIYAREPFRSHSYISPVARGVISGFGPQSYLLGLQGAIWLARSNRV